MTDFNREQDAALRSAFAQLGVRIAPDAKTSEMIPQLEAFQMTATVDQGVLTISQHGAVISTGTALKAFTGKHPEHFVLPGGQVRSKADLQPANTPEGVRQRTELIREQGYDSFAKIISNASLRPGVVASREMSRSDWMNLTTSEKTAAVSSDPGIVAHVMAKRS
jgi:hypothetical protein